MPKWSPWRPFPDPRKHGILIAPFGPGVYELRRRDTGKLVLFGRGRNVASRVSSLLPIPLGTGTRNNAKKRAYVKRNLSRIEYRTRACATDDESKTEERKLKANANTYRFRT